MDLCRDQIGALGDEELLHGLRELASSLRIAECRLLAYLAEVEERRLFARLGFPSLFAFAVTTLRFAEGAACRRIAAARAARRFPEIYDYLADGSLHVTGVAMLAPYLKPDNCTHVLAEASGRTKRELERLIAQLAPKPDTPDLVRRMPLTSDQGVAAGAPASEPAPLFAGRAGAAALGHGSTLVPPVVEEAPGINAAAANLAAPMPPPVAAQTKAEMGAASRTKAKVEPLSPGRNLIRFTASDETVKKLERARELLAHKYPEGKLEDVIDEALEILIEKRDLGRKIARKKARAARQAKRHQEPSAESAGVNTPASPAPTSEPARERSRYIPVAVDEAAWEESEGRCAYVSPDGRRCNSRWLAQRDHARPFALGGRSDDPENIRYRCFAHNALHAVDTFGSWAAQRYTTASDGASAAD
jgi:hypothetical protein